MNIFNFISWWWKELSAPGRVMTIIVVWILPHIIWAILGKAFIAALSWIITGAAGLAIIVCYLIFRAVRAEWIRYNMYVAHEGEQVMNALKGDRVRPNPYSHKKH